MAVASKEEDLYKSGDRFDTGVRLDREKTKANLLLLRSDKARFPLRRRVAAAVLGIASLFNASEADREVDFTKAGSYEHEANSREEDRVGKVVMAEDLKLLFDWAHFGEKSELPFMRIVDREKSDSSGNSDRVEKEIKKRIYGGVKSSEIGLESTRTVGYPEDFLKVAKKLEGYVPNLNKYLLEVIDKYQKEVFIDNLKYLMDIKGFDYLAQLDKVFDVNPRLFLNNIVRLKKTLNKEQIGHLAERVFKNDPSESVVYKENGYVDNRVYLPAVEKAEFDSSKYIKSLKVDKVQDLGALVLLNDLVRHGLGWYEALNLYSDRGLKLFRRLVRIKSEQDHLGKLSVERVLRALSLGEVQLINSLHGQRESNRFSSVENLNSSELYTLMVYGEEEIFTSSFNGMFNLLMKRMSKEFIDGDKLLQQVGKNKFRVFIKELAGFNRLEEFLQTMSEKSSNELLSDIVKDIDKTDDKLTQAMAVADIFSVVKNNKTRSILQEQIRAEYKRVNSENESKKEDKIIYGILSGLFADKAVVNSDWFKEMETEFVLTNFNKVVSADLFNKDDVNVQQYFFYDDRKDDVWDGHNSFKHFLRGYSVKVDWDKQGNISISNNKNKHWRVEDKGSYVYVTSVREQKKIEIYANKPTDQINGVDDIEREFRRKNIQAVNVTHRGHSYHVRDTIDRISEAAEIVFLGSCGGYNNVELVLQRAPRAHILSTKGTGTMSVNDSLLMSINSDILSGNDIIWPEFWSRMKEKFKDNYDFQNYISPDKNLGVMFMKTYMKKLN